MSAESTKVGDWIWHEARKMWIRVCDKSKLGPAQMEAKPWATGQVWRPNEVRIMVVKSQAVLEPAVIAEPKRAVSAKRRSGSRDTENVEAFG